MKQFIQSIQRITICSNKLSFETVLNMRESNPYISIWYNYIQEGIYTDGTFKVIIHKDY